MKPFLGVVVAGDLRYFASCDDIRREVGAAEVKIAVLQSELCLDVALLDDLERRSQRSGEDLQLVNRDFYLAGREILVDGALAACPDGALGAGSSIRF